MEDSLAEEPVVRPILNAPSFASGSIVKATTLAEHHAAIDSQVPCRTESAGCPETTRSSKFHEAAVVGSIVFFTSVIFVAGKPLISACLRIMASSLARRGTSCSRLAAGSRSRRCSATS